MVEDSRADRDQRLQSARKKLKSYRAKQAQMERAKRNSTISNSGSNGSITSSISIPSRLVGSVINEASLESQVAMTGSSSKRASLRMSASMDKGHSRAMSRSGAGHGRGHSRAGSISLSQSALAGGIAAAALDQIAQQTSLSTSTRPLSSHFANTAHSHTRGHSRSGSKSLTARSRPQSLIAARQESAQGAWRDEDSAMLSEAMLKTPTMDSNGAAFQDMDATPQQKTMHQTSIAPITTITLATPTAPSSNHGRRPSRHSRKGSVSTRRESMELMGGLGSLSDAMPSFDSSTSNRHSRKMSSHRFSGLQSASVLFGGMPDLVSVNFEKKRDFDEDQSDDEGGDRLTALEKLEGKGRRDTKQSSVQLPSFDDVHGEEGMDKRASLTLMESNIQTTSNERPPNTVSTSRPQTMLEPLNDEMLDTLMEEEEEEEESAATSPVKERGRFDFINEEEKRKRKEAELEVIKRTRRSSLTPKPLKLKSRPASLFVAPRTPALSASASLPILEQSEEAGAMIEEATTADSSLLSVDSELATSNNPTPTSNTFAPVQESVKTPSTSEFALRPSPAATPSREVKRAWRSSMPIATPSPTLSQHSHTSPSKSSTGSAPRQGMKTLRLGSISSASNGPSPLQQHKNRTDSTSSLASIASNSSTAFSKRGSLLYNTAPNASSAVSREEASPLAKKRSSFMYRTSALDTNTGNLSATSMSPVSQLPTSAPASSTSISMGGVPMGMFEELKSKHQRDVGLLDEARNKIARLEVEVSTETERMSQEYAELERWSAEEKQTLGQRIEHLEASIVEVVQFREAREQVHVEEKQKMEEETEKLRTEFEDMEAERDMLRDDVEGWRMRCSDLEKSLRGERQAMEDLRRAKMAGKVRIKELLQRLQDNDINVERSSIDEEELSAELVAVLRSPNVGPSSPLLGAQRDRSTSPGSHGDAANSIPHPQAVQLLKEMRQQIFNLAGSLDHERKQHLLTRQEADELKLELARQTAHDQSLTDATMTTVDSHFFSPEKVRMNNVQGSSSSNSFNPLPTASTPPHSGERQSFSSVGKSSKKKRNHVFAYDSSMESGSGSNSMGSGSVTTNQTSEHQHDESEGEEKDDEEFVAQVQADLVGLGMGNLGTLTEEEEAISDLGESMQMNAKVQEATSQQRDSFDIESGGREWDVESVAPPTPALDHTHRYNEATSTSVVPPPPIPALPLSKGSSTSSSIESHGPPSPSTRATISSQDTVTATVTATATGATMDASQDEYYSSYEDSLPSKEPRPEFIREWSFDRATAAIRAKKGTNRSKINPTTIVIGQPQKQRKNRKMSIEDFFGIMSLDESQKLPPLPTPEEALEMPPLYIEAYTGGQSKYGQHQPRYPSQIRPPIPQSSSMYARSSSNSDRSSSTSSRHSQPSQQQQQHHHHQNGEFSAGSTSELVSSAQSAGGGGGGMFSKVASLTSAFSGLGGYLIGGGGGGGGASPGVSMAANAAVAASRVCSSDKGDFEDYESRNQSISWAVTRREEEMA